MPKSDLLSYFKPASYSLVKQGDLLRLVIAGQKIGPPSRRISFHQAGLKIIGAKITRFDKHGPVEIEVTRINHLPTIEQVRLHSTSVMYPGRYQIELDYKVSSPKLAELSDAKPDRRLMPSIDETEAWQSANFEFKQ